VCAACKRANPDILGRTDSRGGRPSDEALLIRLSDVTWLLMQDFSGRRCEANIESLRFWWNLQCDSLAGQSDECVGFLYDIVLLLNL
jgi:hypothetical protein